MGVITNSINPHKEESKVGLEPCQVSLEPVEEISSNDHAGRGSSELLKWKTLALTMGLCTFVLLGLHVFQLWRHSEPVEPVTHDTPGFPDYDADYFAPNLPRIIRRAEWQGQPPKEPPIHLNLPVPFVVISHTETDFCQTRSICSLRVRMIQTQNIEVENFSDIGYNFLVGGDGNAYEGRGWDVVGAHTWTYNTRSVGISFVGNFSSVVPPDRQLLAAQQLIELGVSKGKIASDYKLIGHRQNLASKTTSPGDVLYNIIKTWPHWESL